MGYDQQNIAQGTHRIALNSESLVGDAQLGKGLNCADPETPLLATKHPFFRAGRSDNLVSEAKAAKLATLTYKFIDSSDYHSLSSALRANFAGSYGSMSAS